MRDKFADLHFDKQASEWRIDPYGWDSEGRTYFLLDDDRLYRQTDAPIPEPIRKKAKAPARGSRSSKRRRLSRVVESTPEQTEDEAKEEVFDDVNDLEHEENFEGRKWECIAISFDDFQSLIAGIKKSRDPDDRNLCKRLEAEIMPFLHKKEEERQRQEVRRLKELENLQKLATAKRSGRLASKAEQQRQYEQSQEVERKRLAELKMAQKEQEKQYQLEQDRESRMQTREQRLKEREVKRILHEEELRKEQELLAKLAEEEANGGPAGRVAHRQLMADMEKRQKELEALQAEEEEWVFDCSVCGVHGHNLDDGTHSIACDKCSVWQHSACHGIAQEQAEREDFQFICKDCKQKMENPVPVMKLNFSANGTPTSAASTPKKEKKERKPKDPTKPRSNIKVVKKKAPQTTTPGTTPSKPKPLATAGAIVVNGNSASNGQNNAPLNPVPRQSSDAPLVYPGPPPPAPSTSLSPGSTDRFVHYQPNAQSNPLQHQGSSSTASVANHAYGNNNQAPSRPISQIQPAPQFQRPSYPSFPPPGASHLQRSHGGSPVKSNGRSSPPASHPSTPSQAGGHRPIQPYVAHAPPSSQPRSFNHVPGSQGPPRTPSYAPSAVYPLSSPAQHLTAPSPTYHAPALGASESSNHGSSPGYSPKKHASPPRPSPNTQHFLGKDNPIKPPISLSPIARPNITSPPVKKSPSPPNRSNPMMVSSLVDGIVAQTEAQQQTQPKMQVQPTIQNVSTKGQT
jgi:hypothetical protein